MARGRKAIEINAVEFQKLIVLVEQVHTPPTRSSLCQHVEESDWAKAQQPRALTAQVAMLKAKELGLTITTPKGERGRKPGEGLPQAARDAVKGPRRKRTVAPEVLAQQKKNFAPSMHSTLEKAAAGNVKAAIKAMCVDCSGGCRKEVALCEIKTCPLWAFRPYSSKKAVAAAKEGVDKQLEELETV